MLVVDRISGYSAIRFHSLIIDASENLRYYPPSAVIVPLLRRPASMTMYRSPALKVPFETITFRKFVIGAAERDHTARVIAPAERDHT